MNDENVEARLARWKLAEPPPELMRRLHAVAPPAQVPPPLQWRAGGWFGGWSWQPWPLGYAGLLTAWALILALRLLTPSDPPSSARLAGAQIDTAPAAAPALAGTLAAERTFFLARSNSDPL